MISLLLVLVVCANAIVSGGTKQDAASCSMVRTNFHTWDYSYIFPSIRLGPSNAPSFVVFCSRQARARIHAFFRKFETRKKMLVSVILTSNRPAMAMPPKSVVDLIDSIFTQDDKCQTAGHHSAATPTLLLLARWRIGNFPLGTLQQNHVSLRAAVRDSSTPEPSMGANVYASSIQIHPYWI